METLPLTDRPNEEALHRINRTLQDQSPETILRWAVDAFFPRLTMATAFGAEGCVLLAMLAQIEPNGREVRVFNLETGYQFRETLELRERIRERYGITVEYVRASESPEQMEARHGGPLYATSPAECCRIRKVEPLRKAVIGSRAWISAIRKDQTADRSRASVVEWDEKFGLVKVNPLLNWTREDVWLYVHVNEVPYNPLHDQGFPSIGCWPCTRPVLPGEDDRAGRWSNTARRECGLHTRQ